MLVNIKVIFENLWKKSNLRENFININKYVWNFLYCNLINQPLDTVKQYFKNIQHRGPDASGHKIVNNHFWWASFINYKSKAGRKSTIRTRQLYFGFNACGLEIRIPYLDKEFVKYVLNLRGESKMFQNGPEKELLRKSFRQKLPELVSARVMDREKERFSDGCGFSYVPDILNYLYLKTSTTNKKMVTLLDKEDAEKKLYETIYIVFKKQFTFYN